MVNHPNRNMTTEITDEMLLAARDRLEKRLFDLGADIDRLRASHDELLAAAKQALPYMGTGPDVYFAMRLRAAIAKAEELMTC